MRDCVTVTLSHCTGLDPQSGRLLHATATSVLQGLDSTQLLQQSLATCVLVLAGCVVCMWYREWAPLHDIDASTHDLWVYLGHLFQAVLLVAAVAVS
jgi:hypothetical protein